MRKLQIRVRWAAKSIFMFAKYAFGFSDDRDAVTRQIEKGNNLP